MAKPAKKPDRPDRPEPPSQSDQAIVNLLILILLEIKRSNKILRITELNNRQRHEELLAVIDSSDDATKVVYKKVRREPIPQP